MKLPSFQQAVGFSVGDALSLFLLRSILQQENYSKALYERFNLDFPGRSVSYEYVARTANTLENNGFLLSRTEGRKKFFQITEKGKSRLQEYENIYALRFSEVSAVIDRFYYFLTKNGSLPQLRLSHYTKTLDRLYRSCYLLKMLYGLWHCDLA